MEGEGGGSRERVVGITKNLGLLRCFIEHVSFLLEKHRDFITKTLLEMLGGDVSDLESAEDFG